MNTPADALTPIAPPTAFDLRAPIIVIGAGRSGSTLLVRMLDSHPDISFRGETYFLLPRLWTTLWENSFWYRYQAELEQDGHSRDEFDRPEDDRVLAEARSRAGELVARLVPGLLEVDLSRRFWGFKEIWNGSGSHRFAWEPYDHVFPRATWVHLVRHPLDHLGSVLAWNDWEPTLDKLQQGLADWVAIVSYSRDRAATGRFFEVRYEDLKASPRAALAPLFGGVGIEWDEACAGVLRSEFGGARRDRFAEQHLFHLLKPTPELLALAAAYGYSLSGERSARERAG